jgi:uncharacterized protein
MLLRRIPAAVALTVLLASCGSSDKRPQAAAGDAQIDHGRQLFVRNCAGCHTLSAAGTHGSSANVNGRERRDGPNLDQRRISVDDALFAIRNGGFGATLMPSNIVTGDDAQAVARFVARYAGSKAAESPDAGIEHPAVRRMREVPEGAAAGTLPPPSARPNDPAFLRAAFDSAQSLWEREFAGAGLHYQPAKLVFFDREVHTPCGTQPAATGPFYCPAAHGVYLNIGFFDGLSRAYRLDSPFAAGYVTAHEVAHHVQQILGLHARVAAANAQDPSGTNGRSVRVELQADCYAGIWLHAVAHAGQLSQADVDDILTAAAVVGDDYQRNRAGVELAPETWTHGSSQQRMHWVTVGKSTGLPARCDTFSPG